MAVLPKIVAEWQLKGGTKFLVRIKFTSVDEWYKKEYYKTKEVTLDKVEDTGALEDWCTF